MSKKFTDFTDNIRFVLDKQDISDYEKKNVEELIHDIIVYHEELLFQNQELEAAKSSIESYSREIYDLFQNAPIPYVIFDENFKIIQFNTQFQNYIKLSKKELANTKIVEYIADISQDDFYLYYNKIKKRIKAEPIVVFIRDLNSNRRAKVHITLSEMHDSISFRATFTDMTEWFLLNDQLQKTKKYYELIIENSPYSIHSYLIDDNGDLILNMYNQSSVDTLKFEHSGLIGKKIENIFPNLKDKELLENFKKIAKKGGVCREDNYKYKDKLIDGTFSFVAYQPVQNQVIIFFWDTTKYILRKTLQKIEYSISNALVNSSSEQELYKILQDELNEIIDTSNFSIALYNEEKNEFSMVYDSNPNLKLKKIKAENSLSDIVRMNMVTTHFVDFEIESLIKEGKIDNLDLIPKSWLGIPLIQQNNFIGIIIIKNYTSVFEHKKEQIKFLNIIANNISSFIQKKKAENYANILYRSIVYSPVTILITDKDGNIEYANPKCEEITGYKFEEIKGKKTSIFRSGHHSKEFYKELWDTILSGNVWEGKFLNIKKDKSFYLESAKISPVFDHNNQITNFVAIKEDITEREKLIQELKIAKDKAEESDRLKSAFLANMSHEIRTPLNAILGFSSILADEVVDQEEKKEFGRIVQEKGEELLKLIEDILDLSKLEANQLKLSHSIISVSNLFEELKRSYSLFLKKNFHKNIKLIFNKPIPEALQLQTDSMRLRQILDNLINNAIKFTDEGSIEVSCELAKDMVHFVVSDTGIGIAPEQQEIIFERFRQADDDFTTRKYGGVGLGLPIVKKLVELLGGNIWIESEIGKGSKFHFTIAYNSIEK